MAKATRTLTGMSTNPKAQPMYTRKASTADTVTRKRGTGLVRGTGSLLPDNKGGSGRRLYKSP